MKKENALKACYSILRRTTPLDFDCGKLCGGKCCKGDENTGMLLFPGEEMLIDSNINIIEKDGAFFAVCNGTCDRNKRPLACRIYPLFPLICNNENGEEEIRVIYDYRAACPLKYGDFKFNMRFVKAVKRVGKYLLLNKETADFYKILSDELRSVNELSDLLKK